MEFKNYNCFVGTARGVMICKLFLFLWGIAISKSALLMLYSADNVEKQNDIQFQKPDESSEVTSLSFGKEDRIIIGYGNGNVYEFDPIQNKYVNKLKDLAGEGRIVGLHCLDKKIVAAKHDGIINLWSAKKNYYFDINLDTKATLEVLTCHTARSNVVGSGGEYNDFKLWDLETHQCIFKAKSVSY